MGLDCTLKSVSSSPVVQRRLKKGFGAVLQYAKFTLGVDWRMEGRRTGPEVGRTGRTFM